jgi:hypothetical protein
MKVNKEQEEPVSAAEGFYFEYVYVFTAVHYDSADYHSINYSVPMEDNACFGDLGISGMEFINDPFVPGIEVDLGVEIGADIPEGDKVTLASSNPALLHIYMTRAFSRDG